MTERYTITRAELEFILTEITRSQSEEVAYKNDSGHVIGIVELVREIITQ